MMQRTRLLLLIPHLGGGGAEQVTSQLVRHLDPKRFEIHLGLVTRDGPGAKPIPRWVQVHRLNRKRVRQVWFQLIHLIRTERPDVVLSGMAHLNFLVLLLKPFLPPTTRILVRQSTTASTSSGTWLNRLLYRSLYPRADAILCQSDAMAADLAANFAIERAKLKVLANPINIQAIRAALASVPRPAWASTSPRLLFVGRLAREKGIDLLLFAVQEVRQHYPQIHLTILGTGPEETRLKNLSRELNLESAVSFPGYKENLTDFYAHTTLYVQPSRHEGLPNALLEAAAAGLPLVATPSSAGVTNLLQNAPGTWLTQSISAECLAQTILTALAALTSPPPDQEHAPPVRFNHTFLAPFDTRTAVATYATLIELSSAWAAP
jgi:glycosyltransferase involved in cell wall biosynthesis